MACYSRCISLLNHRIVTNSYLFRCIPNSYLITVDRKISILCIAKYRYNHLSRVAIRTKVNNGNFCQKSQLLCVPLIDNIFQNIFFPNQMSKPYTDKSSSRSPEKKDKVMQDHKLEYKENIMTIPNLLTTMRIVSTPFLGYMVTTGAYEWGLGLFVFAGLTDLLDGYVARSFTNQRTALGTALDPLADKLLVSVLTITLTIVNLIPVEPVLGLYRQLLLFCFLLSVGLSFGFLFVWLTSLIVSRDMALIGASFYIRYISLSPPKNFSRFFNLNKPSAKLYPSTLSKANTALQLSLVALTLAAPVFNYIDHPALQTLWYITAVTTFWSGWDYWKNGWSYVKILPKK